MLFVDTESKGLVGPCSTIQYMAEGEPCQYHEVWHAPARDTLNVLEKIADEGWCGFHNAHDQFQMQKAHSVLRLLPTDKPPTVEGWLRVQREARFGPCLKPRTSLDLMLFAVRGPLQSLMRRDDVRVKRVPAALAPWLADELRRSIDLPGIYFHYREGGYQWLVDDHKGTQEEFPDVVLRWGASRGLKPLGEHLLGVPALEYDLPSQFRPKEDLWNPFCEGWVEHSDYHDAYWHVDPRAREYALNDVARLTYGLWVHFGKPPPGDVDSTLACLVGSARWRGYALDLPLLGEIRDAARKRMDSAPRAPKTVLHELRRLAGPAAAMTIRDTCAETLQGIAGERTSDGWNGGFGDADPCAQFARRVVEARSAEKEVDTAEKLLTVGSFHPDMKIIGALSGRMAGAGGLSAHGVSGKQKGSNLREAFILAESGARWDDGELLADRGASMWIEGHEWIHALLEEHLDAGDFDAFEVAIAAAAYDDENLTRDLMSGQKIHAIYGSVMLELGYDVVKKDKALYNNSKRAFLGRLYGAQDPKVSKVLGIPLEKVVENERKLAGRYPGIGRARARVAAAFCSMRQLVERGRVEWSDPADYAESLFGFRRYFTLENRICRSLYDLAQSPPDALRMQTLVERRKGRQQTAGGAVQSALFAAAFGLQASAMRQAANHEIQASGAWITKCLQAAVWELQPCGVHPWVVRPMQIHDELQCPRAPGVDLRPTVAGVIERFRPRVPLLKMEWLRGLRNWAEKG